MTPDLPAGFVPLPERGGFIAHNGPLYVRHVERVVQVGFRVDERHTNPLGICHGGMLATFCDMLLPMVAIRLVPEVANRFLPTISLQIDYVAPAPLGAWVEGTADILRTTRTLVFMQGRVTADGQTIVRTSGIFKIGAVFDRG